MKADIQLTTRDLINPFILSATYHVIVCKLCGFACVANETNTHLKTRHRDIKAERRQNIVNAIKEIPNVFRSQSDLVYLQHPPPTAGPLP
jgi:uncharacterized protein (DUF2225 family)